MEQTAWILLGTNLGDKLDHLAAAREKIGKMAVLKLCSAIYETAAWGYTDQPSFYNQVIEVATELAPEPFLQALLKAELEMGRVRTGKWKERLIDIDLLYYEDRVINLPGLSVPHPELQNRRFTLTPLAEIAPFKIHPVLLKSSSYLLAVCADPLEVKKLAV